ncbi:hypothetical protein ABTY61_25685 [Kitasatospora sp. NPDC096128]|uniref:hypothetical protein n=1 Tax=Kitasatospora sp. NPDC096128 TaxID=3155547 RepID=UPI0033196DCF
MLMVIGIIGSIVDPLPKNTAAGAPAAQPKPAAPATSVAATVPTPSPDPAPNTARPPAPAAPSSAAKAQPTAPQAPPAPASPTTPATTDCGPNRDIIVRYITPGLPPSSSLLGEYAIATCEPTFQSLEKTSPKEAGFCTQAAWASDNPGYEADVTPAPPLKKIQVAYGPACR